MKKMNVLLLEDHIIPMSNILHISREWEPDEEDPGDENLYERVYIHLKNGDAVPVKESFESIHDLLHLDKSSTRRE